MSKMKLFKQAEQMYLKGLTVSEISLELGIAKRTLFYWKKQYGWDKKRKESMYDKSQFKDDLQKFAQKLMEKIANSNKTNSQISQAEYYSLVNILNFLPELKENNTQTKRGYVPSVSHTAKGALLKKVAVCDGYSHAFQMVMRKLKIPCRFVTGSSGSVGHAWNMVKLSGKWYHIDVTFDDPIINGTNTNKKPYYRYFLKSSSVMKKTHHFTASKYPKCNSKKYD